MQPRRDEPEHDDERAVEHDDLPHQRPGIGWTTADQVVSGPRSTATATPAQASVPAAAADTPRAIERTPRQDDARRASAGSTAASPPPGRNSAFEPRSQGPITDRGRGSCRPSRTTKITSQATRKPASWIPPVATWAGMQERGSRARPRIAPNLSRPTTSARLHADEGGDDPADARHRHLGDERPDERVTRHRSTANA